MRARAVTALVRLALTRPRLVELASRGRRNGVDAGLDRQLAAALELARIARTPRMETMDPLTARAYAANGLSATKLTPMAMSCVIAKTLGPNGIPVRTFVPPGAGAHHIVYLHGGGGVIGSIASSEATARYLAARTHCCVTAVDYRLAPEHKHPTAIDDACEAWRAIVARLAPEVRVALVGDSFGAFLTAHVDRWTSLAGVRGPDVQVLVYPLLDLTLTSPSIARLTDGYLLTRPMMEWFRDHYSNPWDDHAAASPWSWRSLRGSAPALVVTAGFDPLVDEGVAWAERLRADGTPVRHHHHPSLIHSFLSFAGLVHAARAATDRMWDELVAMLDSADRPIAAARAAL